MHVFALPPLGVLDAASTVVRYRFVLLYTIAKKILQTFALPSSANFLDVGFDQQRSYRCRFGQFGSESQLFFDILYFLAQLLNGGISVADLFLQLRYFLPSFFHLIRCNFHIYFAHIFGLFGSYHILRRGIVRTRLGRYVGIRCDVR